jgi:hypothetical protein
VGCRIGRHHASILIPEQQVRICASAQDGQNQAGPAPASAGHGVSNGKFAIQAAEDETEMVATDATTASRHAAARDATLIGTERPPSGLARGTSLIYRL